MNSLEILQALRHLSVKYTGVYPADRLPKVWTWSIVIIANTDDYNRPDQHWVAFLHQRTWNRKRISIATDYRLWIPDSSYVFDVTQPRIVGTRNCKECFLKLVDNTVVYFYILCVTAIILISFLICLK